MKSNFLSIAVITATALALFACASKDGSGAPASPASPPPSETSNAQPSGSFQGPLTNSDGETQAILTLDVQENKARLTLSPSGATEMIVLGGDGRSFETNFDAIVLTGAWNGAAWIGTVSNGAKSNSFHLSEGASALAAVSVGAPTGTFDGILTYKTSGGKRPVSLVLAASSRLADALASTLTSKVTLTGSLIDNRGAREILTNVVWDRETSTLSADGTAITSLGTAELRCKMSEVNSNDRDVLACALSNSRGNTPVAAGTLSQKRVVLAPPAPPAQATTPTPKPTPVPVETPAPIAVNKTERVFLGSGAFTTESGVIQNRNLSLTVTLKVEPTGLDQEAVVKFIIDGSRVGAKFTDAVYNSQSGDLRASQMLTLGPIAGSLKLKCAGVSLTAPQYSFSCQYESSVTNVTGEFHLAGVQ